MSNPRVAVIIPSYNHEKFISAAVESVLEQTRKPERFIVVDDGSEDGSLEILKSFESKGVELLTQENAGAHQALNRAVREATEDCDFVAILNSDDVYEPGRIEAAMQFFDEHYDKALVCTHLEVIGQDGARLSSESPRAQWFRAAWSLQGEKDVGLPEWIGTANFPSTTSNIIGRSRYLRSNPFRNYRFAHDYFMLSKAALEGKLGVINKPLLKYRIHEANTMNSDPGPVVSEMLRLQLELYREVGYEAMAQPEMRDRFQRYTRATWNNISAHNAGFFQTLLARLCSAAREDEIEEVLVVLGETSANELHEFPNRVLINQYDGSAPLRVDRSLADKFQKLKDEHRTLKEELESWRELARLRQRLLASKRTAWGIILNRCRDAAADAGKTATEKLSRLRKVVTQNSWLKKRKF